MQHELKMVSLQQQMPNMIEKKQMFSAYGEIVEELYKHASTKVKEVSDSLHEATIKWTELAQFYGEDETKMSSHHFFGYLHSFAQQFAAAHSQSQKRKSNLKKEQARKERQHTKNQQASQTPKDGTDVSLQEDVKNRFKIPVANNESPLQERTEEEKGFSSACSN